ncbi:MAG: hypothetical protein ACRDLE_08040, partial [Gaiellaceae bacterium]
IQSLFGSRLVRADVITMDAGKATDTRIDRGVVTAVVTTTTPPPSVTLRERDGTSWTIPVSTTVTVRLGTQLGTLAQLHRGMRVMVSRPATGSAETIQVEGFGQ